MSVSLQMRAINEAIPFPAIFVVKGSLQESDAVAGFHRAVPSSFQHLDGGPPLCYQATGKSP